MSLYTDCIKRMTITEIRKELKSRKIDSKGPKHVVMQRLLNHVAKLVTSSTGDGSGDGQVDDGYDVGSGHPAKKSNYKKTKTAYEWEKDNPILPTREVGDFPAIGKAEVYRYLENFAKIRDDVAVLPYDEFTYLLSPKVKLKKRTFRRPQKWNFPSTPQEIEYIKNLVMNKKNIIIPVHFASLYKFDNQNDHVVVLDLDMEKEKIKYYDSNYICNTPKNYVEYRRFRVIQTEIYGTLRLYDIKPKLKKNFELEKVYSKYGQKEGLQNNCVVLLFCLLDQLWEGRETVFPKFSQMRKKSGEIMKALEIGTPNFLTEEDMKEWNRQPWGKGR